jgi:hypothetical protein
VPQCDLTFQDKGFTNVPATAGASVRFSAFKNLSDTTTCGDGDVVNGIGAFGSKSIGVDDLLSNPWGPFGSSIPAIPNQSLAFRADVVLGNTVLVKGACEEWPTNGGGDRECQATAYAKDVNPNDDPTTVSSCFIDDGVSANWAGPTARCRRDTSTRSTCTRAPASATSPRASWRARSASPPTPRPLSPSSTGLCVPHPTGWRILGERAR